jgi:serine/threonine-protein kinase
MLTGREVFEQAALMAMLVAHAQQKPRPPSELVPEIPRDLERVVLDLLEKEPARRPQTAQILAERLAALGLADRWTEERRRSFWEGRPARVLMPPQSVTTSRTLPV